MKLYNTLNKQIEEIKPLDPPNVTIYTCGPTVYDYPHIGNWFTFIRYDLLVRTLRLEGLKPKWVMNITDVGHLISDADEGEDKLEKSARREGKTAWDVANFYTDYFLNGLNNLNITKPDFLPKATEHIKEQIELIKVLEGKGLTYKIDDGIYYDTSKFPKYADFARLDLDEQQSGKRVEPNDQKRQPTDFALWKFSPEDHKRDMEWESPWGTGFPGWHIECSAMSMKYLGETMDIHAGGIDHIPVHHSNEIAQSEGATGKQLAKYWMHTNHILMDDEKISKSLGNTVTLEDVENKGYSLEAFRLLVLQSHYRTQSKFSWDDLEAAQNRLKRFQNFAIRRFQNLHPESNSNDQLSVSKNKVMAMLENDLDTPKALVAIEEFIDSVEAKELSDDKSIIETFIQFLDNALGLTLGTVPDISNDQKEVINTRNKARQEKDWPKSDELRDKLSQQGIGLSDTENGAVWFRL